MIVEGEALSGQVPQLTLPQLVRRNAVRVRGEDRHRRRARPSGATATPSSIV